MKIVVFDSGFGSLSVIKEIQKKIKSDIIYFADQKNFPYGKKSRKQLLEIINQSLDNLPLHHVTMVIESTHQTDRQTDRLTD